MVKFLLAIEASDAAVIALLEPIMPVLFSEPFQMDAARLKSLDFCFASLCRSSHQLTTLVQHAVRTLSLSRNEHGWQQSC